MKFRKWLACMLSIYGGITAVNLLAFYFLPLFSPTSFLISRILFIGFAEKRYFLVLVCCLLNVLILLSALWVKKGKWLLPACCFAFFIGDFVQSAFVFITDMNKKFFNPMAVPSALLDILFITLLILYFINCFKGVKRDELGQFVTLLQETIACIEKETNTIREGGSSIWNLGLLQNVVFPEMNELLSYALEGKVFFKYGKSQRLLESTYSMTDSFERLNNTPLGKKILEVQGLYDKL